MTTTAASTSCSRASVFPNSGGTTRWSRTRRPAAGGDSETARQALKARWDNPDFRLLINNGMVIVVHKTKIGKLKDMVLEISAEALEKL